MGRIRPSLWYFISKLKDVDATSERAARNAERGLPPPPKRRQWRVLEERIARLRADYMAGRRSLVEYWHALTYIMRSLTKRCLRLKLSAAVVTLPNDLLDNVTMCAFTYDND